MLTRDSAKGIAEYRVTKNGFSVRLTDRLKVLELLGRHLGLFVDRQEHDFGARDLYVQLAATLGIDKASDQELEEASRLLEGGNEEPHPQ